MMLTTQQVKEWNIKTENNVREYMLKNGVSDYDIDHVVHCCHGIAAEVYDLYPGGSFVTALIEHSLDAIFNADDTNNQYLKQYCWFIRYMLPASEVVKTRRRLK